MSVCHVDCFLAFIAPTPTPGIRNIMSFGQPIQTRIPSKRRDEPCRGYSRLGIFASKKLVLASFSQFAKVVSILGTASSFAVRSNMLIMLLCFDLFFLCQIVDITSTSCSLRQESSNIEQRGFRSPRPVLKFFSATKFACGTSTSCNSRANSGFSGLFTAMLPVPPRPVVKFLLFNVGVPRSGGGPSSVCLFALPNLCQRCPGR